MLVAAMLYSMFPMFILFFVAVQFRWDALATTLIVVISLWLLVVPFLMVLADELSNPPEKRNKKGGHS
jgi:hypothetical protein